MANNNSQLQSIIRELEALKMLYNHLVTRYIDNLNIAAVKFDSNIQAMRDSGIPQEECDEFRDKYYEFDKMNIAKMMKMLMDNNGDLITIRNLYIQPLINQFNSLSGHNMSISSLNLATPQQVRATSNLETHRGGPQDYELQLKSLHLFMNELVNTRDQIRDSFYKEYQKIIQSMESNGVPIQVVNHYTQNFVGRNKNQIDIIINQIQEKDYKQLQGMFNQINSALSSLGRSYSGTPKSM